MPRGGGSLPDDERQPSIPLPSSLTVLERRPDLVLAADGCVLIQLWRTTATIESFLRCEAVIERFSADYERFATLNVVESKVGSPPAAVRQASARVVERFEAKAGARALVIEGSGVKHTGIRMVLTTIQLLVPASTPTPVFARVEEASDWIASHVPELTAAQLVLDVSALRGL